VAIKRWLGLDGIDFAIHMVVTFCMMGFVEATNGPEGLLPAIFAGSIILLGVRRKRALRRGTLDQVQEDDRLAEVEDRVAYLEGLQDRVMELEERLDFTERMLTKQQNERLPG
jgi:hypothetical protein